MATELIMPKNGMDMQEGTLIRWLKNVGDTVEKDEPIMEIETDKVSMESESPASGVLLARYFDEGAVIPVLTVMAYIGQPGEAVPDAPAAGGSAPAATTAAVAAPAPVAAAPTATVSVGDCAATPYAKAMAQEKGISLSAITPTGPHGEIKGRDVEAAGAVKATPLAANVAADLGVSLGSVQGSGFGGKVTRGDVLGAAAPAPTAVATAPVMAAPGEELRRYPMSGMRKTIAKRMTQSHTEIPTAQQNTEIDMTDLLSVRTQVNEALPKERKLSVNDFILRAVGMAVADHPRLRMRIEEDSFVETNLCNVGMAVGMPDGLVVPVVRSADCKDIFTVSAEARDLAEKAKVGRLTSEEMKGGCITVSNLGMFGVHSSSPIINQPEASILGIGTTIDKLALVDGNVVARKVMMLCHVFDHRIVNGTEAAQFEQRVKFLLEHPAQLLLPAGL